MSSKKETIFGMSTRLSTIIEYFNHTSLIGEFSNCYQSLLKKNYLDAQGVVDDVNVKIFTEWSPQIAKTKNALLLITIDNKKSFETNQTDVVFSGAFLREGVAIRIMISNRYLEKEGRWSAKKEGGGKYNLINKLKTSENKLSENSIVSIVDKSLEGNGYVYDRFKEKKIIVTSSQSIAYTAACVADGSRDAAVVFLDQNEPTIELAGPALLVVESGGFVYDLDGSPLVDVLKPRKGCIFLNQKNSILEIKNILENRK